MLLVERSTMESNQRPSFLRVVSTDFTAQMTLIMPLVFCGIYVVLLVLRENISLGSTLIGVGIVVLSITILIRRYLLIQLIYKDKQEVTGEISSTFFNRGSGRVDYTYSFQGENYISGNSVSASKRTQVLKIGDRVVLLVDRRKPTRAFIRDLYL